MRLLAAIGFIAIVIAAGAAVFFFGGYFNIAANEENPSIVNWALVKVRMASVSNHGRGLAAPGNLDDPATIQAGARAFAARGCINCHGAPGLNWQKFSEGLNPDPPDLKEVAPHREPGELFFVVRNGIEMTGMPSFAVAGVDDQEIWKIVAFVRKFPTVSDADFKAWTANP
ncbi:MAG TPA: cytochrome c [Pseudolabrys sp.]|nr:cytochrome c [Pseudolabrys sp.]